MADALNEFLSKSRIKNEIQALRIEDIWENIMGETISRYTDKLQIYGDKLYITTHVAPLKNELMFQKNKIVERVNEALGKKTIKEVIIK